MDIVRFLTKLPYSIVRLKGDLNPHSVSYAIELMANSSSTILFPLVIDGI
jgi:hypothetical protein